jgi:hypothetical protein
MGLERDMKFSGKTAGQEVHKQAIPPIAYKNFSDNDYMLYVAMA